MMSTGQERPLRGIGGFECLEGAVRSHVILRGLLAFAVEDMRKRVSQATGEGVS